jgi:hypothetical protein
MNKREKIVKDKWLGARVDKPTEEKVNEYLNASDDLTMGALVRKSVNEYMLNHPLKESTPDPTTLTKPGE